MSANQSPVFGQGTNGRPGNSLGSGEEVSSGGGLGCAPETGQGLSGERRGLGEKDSSQGEPVVVTGVSHS